MKNQSPGKSSRRTDLLSPLRLYQQHNDLFERTGAGATQSKTQKGSSVQFSSVPFSSAPKKQKKQKYHPWINKHNTAVSKQSMYYTPSLTRAIYQS